MQTVDLIIENAAQLVTCASGGKPKRLLEMQNVGVIERSALAIDAGKIVGVERSDEIHERFESENVIDARNKVVCPAFVDPHTHVVFAGNRLDEFELKIKGADYLEILDSGGGIISTVLAHSYSNYGAKNVDLFAPGSDIFSTVLDNSYDFKSASSMSTPIVSGVAALLLSYFPTLSTAQVKDIILKSSFKPETKVNKPGSKTEVPFRGLSLSGGIVNAYNAVKMAISISITQGK